MAKKKMRNLKIGDVIKAHGKPARIIKVWPLGTYDVVHEDGSYFRVTGLFGVQVAE